ncbi:MAG: MBL fold metallo-hydrolase [Gammaproteobacteria bacterium]|nr:MBL fold metallo-hydrolase [Gammaproteobacteria bacterium]
MGLCVGGLFLSANIALVLADFSASPFDGAPRDEEGRFTNPSGELVHGTLEVRLPFMLRRMGTYFRSGTDAPERVANDGVFLRENAQQGVPTVTWIGHATLLVQMGGVSFLTDPTWSNRPSPVPLLGPKRFVKPGMAIADLPPIDFVVISHNHYDHLDLPTLKALAKRDPTTKFYVPLGNGDLLRKADITGVYELDWGQTANFGSIVIHCLPARHWSKRSINDDNKSLWSSWAITGAEKRFYFSGDTGYFPGFEDIGNKLGPFDLVAVPIGAYEPVAMMRESHMNPEEAVAAALDLQAKKAIAIHYGTFDLSDEPLAEPPKRFLEAAKSSALGGSAAWIVKVGETRTF